MNVSPGTNIDPHFSVKPDGVKIIEHTSKSKSYVYEEFGKKDDSYSFQLDTKLGERIFEVKGLWRNGQTISYIIKVNER